VSILLTVTGVLVLFNLQKKQQLLSCIQSYKEKV